MHPYRKRRTTAVSPPCYTFVKDGEPFYSETLKYIDNLKKANINAKVDIYHGKTHAFDMILFWTDEAKQAKEKLLKEGGIYFE